MAKKKEIDLSEIKSETKYVRQGSIDDENFLYLAGKIQSARDAVEAASETIGEEIKTGDASISSAVSTGDKNIVDAINNITLICQNDDLIAEMQKELPEILAALKEIADAHEIVFADLKKKIEEIDEEIEDLKKRLNPEYEYYFAVRFTDGYFGFFGADELPTYGKTLDGHEIDTVYENAEDKNWDYDGIAHIFIDPSFAALRLTDLSYYFGDAYLAKDITGLNYLDTSAVTDMNCMFENCSSLTTLDVSGFDTSAVTDMNYMFENCSSLTTLDVSGFDTSAVTDMHCMFGNCVKLVTIYSDDAMFVTIKVTYGSNMFVNDDELVGGNGTKYDSNKVTYEMAHIDKEDDPGYFTGK